MNQIQNSVKIVANRFYLKNATKKTFAVSLVLQYTIIFKEMEV